MGVISYANIFTRKPSEITKFISHKTTNSHAIGKDLQSLSVPGWAKLKAVIFRLFIYKFFSVKEI